jgi:hypothetical protein
LVLPAEETSRGIEIFQITCFDLIYRELWAAGEKSRLAQQNIWIFRFTDGMIHQNSYGVKSLWQIRKVIKFREDIMKQSSSGFAPNNGYSFIVRSMNTYTGEFLALL